MLTPNDPPAMSLPPGDGRGAFISTLTGGGSIQTPEEGSTIVLFDYDGRAGKLAARQTISTLHPGLRAAISAPRFWSRPTNVHVYAGNRLHDSIGIFAVATMARSRTWSEWTQGIPSPQFRFRSTGKVPLQL